MDEQAAALTNESHPTKKRGSLAEALEMWAERLRQNPERGFNIGEMECVHCGERLDVLKPAGGCLIATMPDGVMHAQCADEVEAGIQPAAQPDAERVPLPTNVAECECGSVFRIAKSWTSFQCSRCKRVTQV